jgi:hypothetical protein
MKRFKFFALATLALGIAGPATLAARDLRDVRHDYARVDSMRDDIARDQARLQEDIRCGNAEAAARDARDLARDQKIMQWQRRDIRQDNRSSYTRAYR